MSKSVEETRRELFEAWDSQAFADFDHEKDQLGDYVDNIVQQCWMAFNAALDAVEIELPAKLLRVEHDQDWHGVRNGTISACQRSIESLSLGLKIK